MVAGHGFRISLKNEGVGIPRLVIQDVLVYIRCCHCSEHCITADGAWFPTKASRGCQEGSPVPLDSGTTVEERDWLVPFFYRNLRCRVSAIPDKGQSSNYKATIVWNTLVALALDLL